MELEVLKKDAKTEVGSYFISNYPPFSTWSREQVPAAEGVLREPAAEVPLGLYLHIPFCRKRCKFCYFRVYTDKNGRDVDRYMSALADEIAMYRDQPRFAGRQFEFVYFGGGTPSFLSAQQLETLVERINRSWRWDAAREVTFECEPGTLRKSKLEMIKQIGVTRLSLGVEHFTDRLLEDNGRAHLSAEVYKAYDWIRAVGFRQVNIDLIAGMVGETDATWQHSLDEALRLEPDSVTIYQMELPHNAVFSKEMKEGGGRSPVATWEQKRAWLRRAFEQFEQAGYKVSSGYTLAKPSADSGFIYRDSLWRGADLVGTGVASFGHLGGVHMQNLDRWDEYLDAVEAGRLPLNRALPVTREQLLIREFILQLKTGRIAPGYFADKFDVDVLGHFAEALKSLCDEGFATIAADEIRLTREGLLRVDGLLPRFFEPSFRRVRYT